ncbi:RsfA family transcriptional regulator [Massilibacterium senegalense]|uniref:RsfA family transcriptional regulator n=1 Tax=Massilibacterium senegalense TaxID=1632858 RepID=UPI00078571EE|nr:RsfA family transcriptional regulator [Massilibacterium senegalense]
MSTVRQDAWNHDDDVLLAEVILRHIREGSTQLKAFEEVGERLNRTTAACGFRWNALIRQKYKTAIELAKQERKEYKKKNKKVQPLPMKQALTEQGESNSSQEHDLSIDSIIRYLRDMRPIEKEYVKLQKENQLLKEQAEEIEAEKQSIQQKYEALKQKYENIDEDYNVLMDIMNRARKMVVLPEKEHQMKFKMEPNGNLQRIDS